MTADATISPARRRDLAAAIVSTAAVGTTMGLTWPLLSLILHRQGIDNAVIGLSSASQSLAVLLVSPFAPRVIGRYGMVKTIGGCVAVIVVALCLLPIFENVQAWFPIRFALGAGVAILLIASQTWINQIVPDHARGRIIGFFGLLWSTGFAAGPLVIRITGIEGWPPFLVAIGLAGSAALPLLMASNTPSQEPAQSGKKGLLVILRIGGPAIAASLMLGVWDSVNDSFLPLYGLRNGLPQASAVTMLSVLLVGVLAIQLPIGWAADKASRTGLLAVLTALALIVSLVLPWAVASEFGLWLALFILGMATGGIWTVSLVLVGQRFQGRDLAAASMLQSLLYGLGSVLAPPFTGFALDASSRIGLPLVLAVDCAMFILLQVMVQRSRRTSR